MFPSIYHENNFVVAIFQSLSHVHLFATPWTVACQTPLSSIIFWSLLRFMSIELAMLSNHLILCCPLLLLHLIFPSIRVFLVLWPGTEPRPPALAARSLNHWTTKEILFVYTLLILLSFSHHLLYKTARRIKPNSTNSETFPELLSKAEDKRLCWQISLWLCNDESQAGS